MSREVFFLFKFAHVQNRAYIARDSSNGITNNMTKLTVREKKAAKFAVLSLKSDSLEVFNKVGGSLAKLDKGDLKKGVYLAFFGGHKFKLGDHLLFFK